MVVKIQVQFFQVVTPCSVSQLHAGSYMTSQSTRSQLEKTELIIDISGTTK
jgi:hypothetical protein